MNNYFSENITVDPKPTKQKNSVSIPTLIISIIATMVFVFIIASKRWNIMSFIGLDSQEEQTSNTQFHIGDGISFSWRIYDDWDIINYTHSIESAEFGKIALKSSNINLNNYKDDVFVEWIVEKIYQWMPVVWVSIIYSLDIQEEDIEWDELWELSHESVFLPKIGIYLDEEFIQKYSLLNEWEWWILKIKDSDTNEIINLNYFKCSSSDNNTNCERFNKTFSESHAEKFIDSYGTTYYKQTETQSRFFSNDLLFGYFINDTNDAEVKNLIKNIQIINNNFVEKNILNKIDILCQESWKWIKKIDESILSLKDLELLVNIKWKDENESFECKLKINPSLKNMATLVELKSTWKLEDKDKENNTEKWDNKEKVETNYNRDTDTPQFPINLEKSLKFTSRKWYSFTFPSSNIAYASQNTEEDFDQVWVNCYSVMHVVQYSEKELLDQKWNVKIYECTIKKWFEESKKLIHKKEWEKDFIIEIVDPARVTFANNILINVE